MDAPAADPSERPSSHPSPLAPPDSTYRDGRERSSERVDEQRDAASGVGGVLSITNQIEVQDGG
jgi:hypothetical protein